MRFMNEYDLEFARRRFGRGRTPSRAYLAAVVTQLADWADANSDGWAYWPKPTRAAAGAMSLIDSFTFQENERQESVDVSESDVRDAVRPIRTFLEHHGADPETVLGGEHYQQWRTEVDEQGALFDRAATRPPALRRPMPQLAAQAHMNRPALRPPAPRPRNAVELRRPAPATGVAR
ncbi:hypothetical protein PD653_2192 [Nocardioides sp. PD653]|nr:hypothetical protein PD653_2192 [Nocardioides sp. PD653]